MRLNTENGFSNPQAEAAVLGIIIKQAQECGEAFALEARDFTDGTHRTLYKELFKMHSENRLIDMVTVADRCPELDVMYLADLVRDGLVVSAQIPAYVKLLKTLTVRRDFRALGAHIIKRAEEGGEFDAADLTDRIRQYLKQLSDTEGEHVEIDEDLIRLHDLMFDPACRVQGIRLGLKGLDTLTDGLKGGRLYVVGARPSVGKTVFGVHAALQCALAGKGVLYVNREMEKTDLLKRMVSNLTGIGMGKMEQNALREEDYDAFSDTLGALYKLPIYISNHARTPAQIRSAALQLHEKNGLGLIVIDYLQRVVPGKACRTRDEEVGELSRAFKDLALDLNVPVILLSQLNRSAGNMRPNMAMLRESGNIEQDADVIILLHAPEEAEVPAAQKEQWRTVTDSGAKYMEMIVDKNRHGQSRITTAGFIGEKMRYYNL